MSRTETETVTALEMYVTRYFDAIEMSDAKKLVEGFREFLAQNPHTGQIITPSRVVEENVADKPTVQIVAYDVFSWRPGPANSGEKCTEVHLVLPFNVEDISIRVALRLKSTRALDELVGVLLQHRKDVWP